MDPIIAANWKMNKTVKEAVSFIKDFKELVKAITNVNIIICPSSTSLYPIHEELGDSNINLGAQNIYFEKEGAFTGELSPLMAKELCKYVIIGHSERRGIFNEDNSLINKKLTAALDNNLTPIFCIGESLEEKEAGKSKDVVKKQIKEGLKGIDTKKIIIAYEPIWAIGTGKTATPDIAQDMHSFIKEIGGNVPVLYGGSVKPENIVELIKEKDIDGALVGGASLDAKSFSEIVKGSMS
jgi:triosephosphate isomerase